jgi:hypothetical protein
MKWAIESVTQNDNPTITVRIAITRGDGTVFYDQNSIADTATQEEIMALCDEMCAKHDDAPKKDFSHLVGLSNA